MVQEDGIMGQGGCKEMDRSREIRHMEAEREEGLFLAWVAWGVVPVSLMRTHREYHWLGFGHVGLEQVWSRPHVLGVGGGQGSDVALGGRASGRCPWARR